MTFARRNRQSKKIKNMKNIQIVSTTKYIIFEYRMDKIIIILKDLPDTLNYICLIEEKITR